MKVANRKLKGECRKLNLAVHKAKISLQEAVYVCFRKLKGDTRELKVGYSAVEMKLQKECNWLQNL